MGRARRVGLLGLVGLLCACSEAPPPGDPFPGGSAVIAGRVVFRGTPPPRRRIDTGGTDDCEAHGELLTEDVIVGGAGGLGNVFVRIKRGLERWHFAPVTERALLDQVGCRYTPRVQGVRTGQPLRIRNSDGFLHNVLATRDGNILFNLSQAGGGEATRSFEESGLVRLGCQVHSWMSAFVWVVGHPFFGVSKTDGSFSLEGLPPGEYSVEAWHETYGGKEYTVAVAAGETTRIEISYP